MYEEEGSAGVAFTLTQSYKLEGTDKVVSKPVLYVSRAKTTVELNHGKVDGESLIVLSSMNEAQEVYVWNQIHMCGELQAAAIHTLRRYQ